MENAEPSFNLLLQGQSGGQQEPESLAVRAGFLLEILFQRKVLAFGDLVGAMTQGAGVSGNAEVHTGGLQLGCGV